MWTWLVSLLTPPPRGTSKDSRSDEDGPDPTPFKPSSAPDQLPPPLRVLYWTARDV